jgi:hypothetical protein
MSEENKQQNTEAMQYDAVLCAVPSKAIQDYIDLIEYNEQQMFKMCGIPKEMFGIDKPKPKRKWWQFWKWHCT